MNDKARTWLLVATASAALFALILPDGGEPRPVIDVTPGMSHSEFLSELRTQPAYRHASAEEIAHQMDITCDQFKDGLWTVETYVEAASEYSPDWARNILLTGLRLYCPDVTP